jgi:hypothetical protein
MTPTKRHTSFTLNFVYFAAVHESLVGTKRTCRLRCAMSASLIGRFGSSAFTGTADGLSDETISAAVLDCGLSWRSIPPIGGIHRMD